jgi:hypothetical protein
LTPSSAALSAAASSADLAASTCRRQVGSHTLRQNQTRGGGERRRR